MRVETARSSERFFLAHNLTDLVSNTPLLRLCRLGGIPEGISIYAKAEWLNPGGSVKDRAAWWMIREGLRTGRLSAGKTILDATSGNTGIAYAWMGAHLGHPVVLAVPGSANAERKRMLKALGAELILTDPLEGSDGAIRKAQEVYAQNPEKYFFPDQYNNPENARAHYESTGPEIWGQTQGRITHFVAGLGTSGTMMGAGRYLREKNPGIRLVAVQPDAPFHGLEGLKHMQSAIVPGIYDARLADENVFVSTEEAQRMVVRLAREEGLLAGVSGGAAAAAALEVAQRVYLGKAEASLVVLFPDGGERYLSETFWSELP
ncbi:MAG: cysteine synthase family protein [Elusimicrobia bacterium]|nr:cysteine synthase family protein [Elusimicrobiota bacterium]